MNNPQHQVYYTLDSRSHNLMYKTLTLNKWVQHFSGNLEMSPHLGTVSYPSGGTVLWVQNRWPRHWFGAPAQQTIKENYSFVILMPLSFKFHNSRKDLNCYWAKILFFLAKSFFLFISLFPLSLLSCHTQCNFPNPFPDPLQIEGQCFQLLGSESKYLLRWNRDWRQYFVP